jgi:ATP-dependent DNA ligase
VHLRSRNDNDFSIRYPAIVKGLAKLPDETVIDGEVIALDEDGRPSFNVLQNYGSSKAVVYFVFDFMMLAGQDVMNQPLTARRQLLEHKVLPRLTDPVRYAGPLGATLPVLIESVKAQGLEGLVTKRLDSRYESGLRTGAGQKCGSTAGRNSSLAATSSSYRDQYVRGEPCSRKYATRAQPAGCVASGTGGGSAATRDIR